MGWLDDAVKWIDDRRHETETLTTVVAEAAEATIKPLQEQIISAEKATDTWTKELEDVVLKSGTIPYEILPQPIKDQLEKLRKDSAALSEATHGIIADLQIPEIPEIPVPADMFDALKQILSIIRVPGYLFLNWMRITEKIFIENQTLLEELKRYGR